jgi:hypothetical protein
MEQDADRGMGLLTPIEHHEINIHSSAEDADQRHRIRPSDAAEGEERQQAPHTAVATPPPTFRPILPKEAQMLH